MKVCFDANVVIDIAMKDQWFEESYIAYDVTALRKFDAYIAASSTSDIVYVLHRRGLSRSESTQALPMMFQLFDVFDVTEADCKRAYESEMSDYEDALISFAAERNGIDVIVTRNVKDFAHSPVKAMSPKEFADAFKPEGVSYEMVDLPGA